MTTLKKIAAAVCAAACIASVSAAPDDISKLNPYGLVYQGAVKTNTAGEVNIHPVTYSLHGIKIAANVYTPANYDAKQSYRQSLWRIPTAAQRSRWPVSSRSASLHSATSRLRPMPLIKAPAGRAASHRQTAVPYRGYPRHGLVSPLLSRR